MKNTMTNTNNTNNTMKEEITMKNTKRTNKITRKIAAMLAAVMAMSTMAAIGASAATDVDAVVHMNTNAAMNTETEGEEKSFQWKDGKIILDDDMNQIKEITAKTIFAILGEVPGSKFFTPTLEALLDSYVGTVDPTQLKLDGINGKLDTLFDKVDKMEQSIKNLLQNELKMTAFYNAYVNFKADTEYFARKINETMSSKTLSNADKLAKIGSLAGSLKSWQKSFDNSLTVLNTFITDTSLGTNTSIFDVVYNNSCANVMFSNEAVKKAKPVCEAIVQTYTAGCTAILECLSAQLYVNNLSDDMRAQINPKYLNEINASDEEIINEIEYVAKFVFGDYNENRYFSKNVTVSRASNNSLTPNYRKETKTIEIDYHSDDIISVTPNSDGTYDVNSAEHGLQRGMTLVDRSAYDKSNTFAVLCENTFNNKKKTTLVNNGLCSIDLYSKLFTKNFKDVKKVCNAGDDSKKEADKQAKWFNENVVSGHINGDYVKDIAAYAAKQGKTIRQLLNDNGFDTSDIARNTYIITDKAFSKCVSNNWFQNKSDALFKGINIDAELTPVKNGNAADQDVKFWKVGWEGINGLSYYSVNRWNSNHNGNACRFQLA